MQLFQIRYRKYIFCFCFLSTILLTACGIEKPVYLEQPRRTYDTSHLDDLSKRYCEFNTADTANATQAAGYIKGTEIYYRIYERKNDCENDRSQINQYNDSSPYAAAKYLEEKKKYYRLETNQISTRPVIGTHSSDASIRFRLQDYGSPVIDPAQLTINGVSRGIPRRDSRIQNNSKIFNKDNIAIGDDDVQAASSSGTEEYWYVNFYAVSYGYTAAFTPLYSKLEYLGYILIEKNP